MSISASDTEGFLLNAPTYRIVTEGNRSIQTVQTGFLVGDPPRPASYGETSSLFYLVFTNTLTPGSTINSALLDLELLLSLGGLSVVETSSSAPGNPHNSAAQLAAWAAYSPVFTSSASGGFITIQSGSVSYTLAANTTVKTDLDLLAEGFGIPLAAGNNLTVSWSESLTFTASNSGYTDFCKNCEKELAVSQTLTGDASGTLRISYNGLPEQPPNPEIPEPASLVLIGGGLVVLGWLSRKRIRT